MATGREPLDTIIDAEVAFMEQHDRAPRVLKLPVRMAYDLAKCGRNEIGEMSDRVFRQGITVVEKEGFHGMKVQIVRTRIATLQLV